MSLVPTKVQGGFPQGSASAAVTWHFTTTPVVGNLLVCAAQGTNAATNGSITGWTKAKNVLYGSTGEIALFYRQAQSGDGVNVTLNWTGSTQTNMGLAEWSVSDAGVTWTLDQTASVATTGSGVTSRSSGTTPTTTQADELLIAVFGMGSTVTAQSYSNSFVELSNLGGATGFWASRVVSATGAYETTESWTTSRVAGGLICTFKAVAAGASAALSGTAVPSMTEAEVRAGGKTIVIDLTGTTWIVP